MAFLTMEVSGREGRVVEEPATTNLLQTRLRFAAPVTRRVRSWSLWCSLTVPSGRADKVSSVIVLFDGRFEVRSMTKLPVTVVEGVSALPGARPRVHRVRHR